MKQPHISYEVLQKVLEYKALLLPKGLCSQVRFTYSKSKLLYANSLPLIFSWSNQSYFNSRLTNLCSNRYYPQYETKQKGYCSFL